MNKKQVMIGLCSILVLMLISGINANQIISLEKSELGLETENPSSYGLTIGGDEYTLELISATDISAEINVTDSGGSESEVINEGEFVVLKEILLSPFNTFESTAAGLQGADIFVLSGEKISLSKNSPSETINFGNEEFFLNLKSATDISAEINVTDSGGSESEVINENEFKIVQNLFVFTSTAFESAALNTFESDLFVPSSSSDFLVNPLQDNPEEENNETTSEVDNDTIEEESESEINSNGSKTDEESENKILTQNETSEEATSELSCNQGCLVGGRCVQVGYRMNRQYCGVSGNFFLQLADNSACSNDFECQSNLCVSSQCAISQSLFERIINWFRKLFGG